VESGMAAAGHRSVASMPTVDGKLPLGAAIRAVPSVVGEAEFGTTGEGLAQLHPIQGIRGLTNPFPARSRCRR